MSAEEDTWVVVDKTMDGALRAKGSQESLYLSDDSEGAKARVHVQGGQEDMAPELLDWINNAARESATALPLADRNPSTSKSSYRTNSSSANQRKQRRSSVHATTDASSLLGDHLSQEDGFNEGMFVVKVLEVRQRGSNRSMNLQCVAQVGNERFVIPAVTTRPKDHQLWAARMNDTFVFDVSRQFTFNLGVYGTQPHAAARSRAGSVLSTRMSLRHPLARSSMAPGPNDSNPSLLSNSSARTTAKIRRGLRKIFKNKSDAIASDPAYSGFCEPLATPTSALGPMAASGSRPMSVVPEELEADCVRSEQATDAHGRQLEIQKHGGSVMEGLPKHANVMEELPRHGGAAEGAQVPAGLCAFPEPEYAQHPAISRLSSYLPRSRTATTTSAHEINYGGPRLRAFSNATSVGGGTPQPLGELFLDMRVDRKEKRRATFTLPVVNQGQVAMRGGAHVEMEVILEYGILVHETCEERALRLKQEQAQMLHDRAAEKQQRLEADWARADEQDRLPRLRGFLSVFTRSGHVSTWKRYWAVLSPTRILFFDSEADQVQQHQPVAKVSLLHMHAAGRPETDVVSIGPTGIELRLSPLAMTDRHRRKSAFPRRPACEDPARRLQREASRHPLPNSSLADTMDSLRISTPSPADHDEDDETLYEYSDWRCRVYLLLDTLKDRDLWLDQLARSCMPSCEFARFRARQRRAWRTQEFETATENLRQSGKQLQVITSPVSKHTYEKVGAKPFSFEKLGSFEKIGSFDRPAVVSLEKIGSFGKPAFALEKVGSPFSKPFQAPFQAHGPNQKLKPPPVIHNDEEEEDELAGDTLTAGTGAKKTILVPYGVRKPVVTAFGKPATFDIAVEPAATLVRMPATPMPPPKKRMRAHRRSSSVGDLRTHAFSSSDDASDSTTAPSLARRDSGASTVIEVVGRTVQRRPGTVSRRFLFVWNVNDS